MFFCCVEMWISGISVFDRPVGPQFSSVQRSISSVEVSWLIFNMFVVMVRCGILKNAI